MALKCNKYKFKGTTTKRIVMVPVFDQPWELPMRTPVVRERKPMRELKASGRLLMVRNFSLITACSSGQFVSARRVMS